MGKSSFANWEKIVLSRSRGMMMASIVLGSTSIEFYVIVFYFIVFTRDIY